MVRVTGVTATIGLLLLAVISTTTSVVDAQPVDVCSTVTCLSNGDSECNRATAACPACMYTISGGYSCYDKVGGACPFADVLITCPPKAAPTPAPTPKPSPTPTVAPATELPATVAPPQIDTPPATTAVSTATAPPQSTTATPSSSPSGSDPGQATSGARPGSIQNNPTSSTAESSSDSASLRNGSAAAATAASPAPSKEKASDSSTTSTPSPPTQAMDASSGLAAGKKSSTLYVNIGVAVAAVAGVAIVAAFIVRRMKQRREEQFLKTPEDEKQFDFQVDGGTGGRGAAGSGGAPGAVGGPGGPVFAIAGVAAAGGASNRGRRDSTSSDLPSLLSMASMNSSTVEFANQHPPYGLPSRFGLPSEVSSYTRSTNASFASSTMSSGTAGQPAPASVRAAPRPQAIQEGDEFALYSKRKQGTLTPAIDTSVQSSARSQQPIASGGARTPAATSARPVHQPIYHESVRRNTRATSAATGASFEDEYDIVRPGALKDADRRNTETLVMDGRFQSNFSERDVRAVQRDRRFFASKENEI